MNSIFIAYMSTVYSICLHTLTLRQILDPIKVEFLYEVNKEDKSTGFLKVDFIC